MLLVCPAAAGKTRCAYEALRTQVPRWQFRNSRDVLELARRSTLGSMSEREWARAEELASADPRIEQAAHHRRQAKLTRVLSAAPELHARTL